MQAMRFHETLQLLGSLKEGDILYQENGHLCVQTKAHPLFSLFRWKKTPATHDQITNALIPLFAQGSFVPPEELPGLQFCKRHFACLPTHTSSSKQALEFCDRFLEPFKVRDLPADLMCLIKGYCRTFRLSSKQLSNSLSFEHIFVNEQIQSRAKTGEPQAVRMLVKYLLINLQADNLNEARKRFEYFHSHAQPAAKILFWRAIFYTGGNELLEKLFPLDCLRDLVLQFDKERPPSTIDFVEKLIRNCPNLERLEIRCDLEGQEKKLSRAIMACKKLSSLSLFTQGSLDLSSFRAWVVHPALRELCHHHRSTDEDDTTYDYFWGQIIPLMRRLTSLTLDGEVDDIPSLSELKSLQRLSLKGFRSSAEFRTALATLTSLTSLTLELSGQPELLTSISSLTSLEELSTKVKHLTHEEIVQKLSTLTKLRSLELYGFTIFPDNAFVYNILRQLPLVSKIVIEDPIDGFGFSFLQSILQERAITHLGLRFLNPVPVEFSSTLLQMPTLRHLSLAEEDRENPSFGEALGRLTHKSNIEVLEYEHARVNADLFTVNLWANVAKLPRLNKVKVGGPFGDKDASALGRATNLTHFSCLDSAQLSQLSQKGLRSLLRIKTLRECSLSTENCIEVQPVLETLMRQKHIHAFRLRTHSRYFLGEEKKLQHLERLDLTPADASASCSGDTITQPLVEL